MIPTLLILFFLSLAGIIGMMGKKIILLRKEGTIEISGEPPMPYLKDVKELTIRNVKKYGYTGLVETIRLYVKSENFIKVKYEEVKIKVKNRLIKSNGLDGLERKEANKFLRMVSEYKQKLQHIKHRVKKEEEIK